MISDRFGVLGFLQWKPKRLRSLWRLPLSWPSRIQLEISCKFSSMEVCNSSASLCLLFSSKPRTQLTCAFCALYRYDNNSHDQFKPGDPSKKAFTYFVLTGGRFVYASAIRLAVLKFLMSMSVRKQFTTLTLVLTHSLLLLLAKYEFLHEFPHRNQSKKNSDIAFFTSPLSCLPSISSSNCCSSTAANARACLEELCPVVGR